jgi:hypothetical protein
MVGLLEEDHWMIEVNLGDMETTLRDQEEYWLVTIRVTSQTQNQVVLNKISKLKKMA